MAVGARGAPLTRALRAAGAALLDLAVPKRCALCGRFDTFLCDACTAELSPAVSPRCPTCWGLLDRSRCWSCAAVLGSSLAGVRAAYQLEGGARRLVHMLKYEGCSALAEPMGRLMAGQFLDWGIRPEIVTAVPLHPSRQRQRGFNQAGQLARACAAATGLPLDTNLLARVRRTEP